MNKIEIMRADPVIECDNGTRLVIRGSQRDLFRLLVIHEGRTVPHSVIADLRDTEVDSTRSAVRYLRDQLKSIGHSELIEIDRGNGYRAEIGGWQVDALDFRKALEPFNGSSETPVPAAIDVETARKNIRTLKSALLLWNGNPALRLPSDLGFEARFDGLRDTAQRRLLISQLQSEQDDEIRDAIQQLEHRSRSMPDDQTWELLLLAYEATGNLGRSASTWERIVDHYAMRVPEKLSRLQEFISSGKNKNPFRFPTSVMMAPPSNNNSPDSQTHDDSSLDNLCQMLGITTASQMRLANTHLTPRACIRRTRSRLYFSGVLASKWVLEGAVRSEFSQLLSRLDENKGDVRFLMINPKGDGFQRLNELRQGNLSLESVDPLRQLAEKHTSLQVRLYDSLPAFRIVVIDDEVVSFSPYRLAAAAYLASDAGWEAPHVVLDPMAKYPLADAFLLLFEETWRSAKPIGEVL